MRLPIDTSGMAFVVAGPPEAVRDFETKQQKTDETGAQLFAVPIMVLGESQPEIIAVKLAGAPGDLSAGQAAKVTALVATPWSMGDRSGVSFRAAKIEVAAAPGHRQSS